MARLCKNNTRKIAAAASLMNTPIPHGLKKR
jgi:hypothetical protein